MNTADFEYYHDKNLHGTADFPYIAYTRSIPRDYPIVPLHWHEEVELVYVKNGHGVVSIDLERYPVTAGSIVLILPGQLHSIEAKKQETLEYENILFHLNLLMGKEQDICTRDYFKPILQGSCCLPQLITPALAWYSAFASCIDETNEICKYYPAAYPLAIKSKLFQLFYILFYNEAVPMPKSRPQKSIDKAKYILQYISEHFDGHLSVESMAQVCQLSESHFMKFFKSTVGMTFTEYLNDYRLVAAGRLLRSTTEPVISIAAVCGYDNVSYFNRLFKRKYGTTPSNYRKSGRSKIFART